MTEFAKRIRKSVLKISYSGQDGNLQSVFSSIDIICTLYDDIMTYYPDIPDSLERDYFVLSKGQATMGLLAILADKGFFSHDEFKTACRYDSIISMQADRTKVPGIEISAGSLGHGFPIAAGIAYAMKTMGRKNRVFTLAGDGEMNEGTMWEAALFAGSEKLDNLTLIIDDNNSISEMLDMGSLVSKLDSFGFDCYCTDGHNRDSLVSVLEKTSNGKPKAVIAKTIRGYGSHIMMSDRKWFHRAPNEEELKMLLEDVDNFEICNDEQRFSAD